MLLLIYILGLLPVIICSSNKKPILQEILLPKNLNLNQVRLNCDLEEGLTPLNFKWYHNNKELNDNNKTIIKIRDDSAVLIIKSINEDDLGDYKCTVKNSYGENSQKVSLYLKIKPHWILEPNDIVSSLFSQIEVECKASGFPNPSIQWFKLSNDNKKIIKEFDSSNKIKFQLNKDTSGLYKCVASNSVGSIEKIINLKYYGK